MRAESRAGLDVRREEVLRRARTPVTAAFALLGVGWIALLVWLSLVGPGDHPWRDDVLYLALMFGAAMLTLVRAALVRADRVVWVTVGLGLVLTAGGDALYVWAPEATVDEALWQVADALYLAYYPLMFVALVLYIRRYARDVPTALVGDAVTLSLAVGATVGAVFLAPLTFATEGSLQEIVVGASYPVGDTLLLLVTAAGITVLGVRRAPVLLWVGGATAVAALADLTYWALSAYGPYVEGEPLDALWPLASLLVAAGAWAAGPALSAPPSTSGRLGAVPSVSLVLATVTLVYGAVAEAPLSSVILAVLAIAGVLGRLWGAARELRLRLQAQRDAATDDLSGLLNRRGFTQSAHEALADPGRTGVAALLIADLDGFKAVNDSLGHGAGDAVLCEAATRIVAALGSRESIVGRLGGDEFAILTPEVDAVGARDIAAQIAAALEDRIQVEDTSVSLKASIGLAAAPEHGVDLSVLMRRADIAMYRAKADGLEVAVFDPARDLAGEDYLQRVAALRQGIDSGELVLHFQPKITLATGEVEGVEALVRWYRPGIGLIYPEHFLPLAHKAGLMEKLTDEVIRLAVDQAARWRTHDRICPIAINLPITALMDPKLPARIGALLTSHGLTGRALEVEITEESLLGDRRRVQRALMRLRALGIRSAIDDYGTGYSSLVFLQSLVVDEVKIDRSYIEPMLSDERSAFIVKSTIDLAHALGMRVVAEGIERSEVAERLAAIGCDAAQGYFWAKPAPAEHYEQWLAHHSAHVM